MQERWLRTFFSLLLATAAGAAHCQGFSAAASPPRFELSATPAQRLRQVVEISNVGAQPAKYRIRTADWTFEPDASVVFHDALQPGSCRPWVALERTELTLAGGSRARFRFEVAAPADAPVGECRFAILIEGDEPVVARSENLQIPVTGRLGVIVYVAVGGAAPELEIVRTGIETSQGRRSPTLWVKNTGNAHGRLAGFLSGVDASGRELEFTPSTFPVMPGETRALTLAGQVSQDKAADPVFPITIRGTLEWTGNRIPFEQRFE